jgi:hypothetical protein
MHCRDAARCTRFPEALPDRREQRIRHRMATAGTADQQRVSILQKGCGLGRGDLSHPETPWNTKAGNEHGASRRGLVELTPALPRPV